MSSPSSAGSPRPEPTVIKDLQQYYIKPGKYTGMAVWACIICNHSPFVHHLTLTGRRCATCDCVVRFNDG